MIKLEMEIKIKRSTLGDIETIMQLYKKAIAYQNEKKGIPWQMLGREVIENEVNENRQYKLLIDNEIACVWVITFSDPEIWGDRDLLPSFYLHRITTNPKFRGNNIVSEVISWAKEFAIHKGRKFLRLDTAGINLGLITKYVKNGFAFVEITEMGESDKLQTHYHNAQICLFEINLG